MFGAVVASLPLLLLAATVPASAHTGTASAWFTSYTSWQRADGAFATVKDPDLNLVSGQASFDHHATNGSDDFCNAPTLAIEDLAAYRRPLNSSGEPTAAWSLHNQTKCYRASRAHTAWTPPAGTAHVEWKLQGATSGTIYAAASTFGALGGQSPPTNLRVTASSEGNPSTNGDASVALAWDAGDGATSHRVERTSTPADTSSWVVLGSVSVLTYSDTGLDEGKGYCYRVRARGGGVGLSAPSNVVCVEAGVIGSEQPWDGSGGEWNGGDSTDPDSGQSCGLNPFCWFKAALRWAFWPGEATADAWNDFYATVSGRPPFSLVIGGVTLVVTHVQQFVDAMGAQESCVDVPGPSPTGPSIVNTPTCFGPTMVDLANSHIGWVRWVRWVIGAVIVISTALKVWRIMAGAFGHQQAGEGEGFGTDDAERHYAPDTE